MFDDIIIAYVLSSTTRQRGDPAVTKTLPEQAGQGDATGSP